MDIAQLVADFGFPVVMVVGLGYFVYFVWQTITKKIDPCCGANENHNHTLNRPTTTARPRYDTITDESEYCFGIKGR